MCPWSQPSSSSPERKDMIWKGFYLLTSNGDVLSNDEGKFIIVISVAVVDSSHSRRQSTLLQHWFGQNRLLRFRWRLEIENCFKIIFRENTFCLDVRELKELFLLTLELLEESTERRVDSRLRDLRL